MHQLHPLWRQDGFYGDPLNIHGLTSPPSESMTTDHTTPGSVCSGPLQPNNNSLSQYDTIHPAQSLAASQGSATSPLPQYDTTRPSQSPALSQGSATSSLPQYDTTCLSQSPAVFQDSMGCRLCQNSFFDPASKSNRCVVQS